jgi:hypothetical protein
MTVAAGRHAGDGDVVGRAAAVTVAVFVTTRRAVIVTSPVRSSSVDSLKTT